MTGPAADDGRRRRRHIVVQGFSATERFRPPGGGSARPVPARNREQHAAQLRNDLESVANELTAVFDSAPDIDGFQVEFEGFAGVELAFESLGRERMGIELLNVRREGDTTSATVFVPEGKLAHFEKIIRDYVGERRDKRGHAIDHVALVNTIQSIRIGTIESLWTDTADARPLTDAESVWLEVWLTTRGGREEVVRAFRGAAEVAGIRVAPGVLEFPERSVLLAFGATRQLRGSVAALTLVAELRRAKETASFFDSLAVDEQRDWVAELLLRCTFPPTAASTPAVCVLDTGVNRSHPLLEPALAADDAHTVEPAWGPADTHGHGTEMAGLALFGDLTQVLEGASPVVLRHRLESVKLLPDDGANGNDSRHHGYLTTEAAARAEVAAPERERVFQMAVSSRDNRDSGRPTAWAAAIDSLASDYDGDGAAPRLFAVCAGNADTGLEPAYPGRNSRDGIHDPGQAWNALTVGGCTFLTRITEVDSEAYQTVAPAGGLSPYSTTSVPWDPQWPLKPDVVFEAGNVSRDTLGTYSTPSLSVLTAFYRPNERLLTTSWGTSASTALAARMAAQLMADYPALRPETIRGLIVHSAQWSPVMSESFLPAQPLKRDYEQLVRNCGFGIPDLERATWSLNNAVSLVVEDQLRPFEKVGAEPTLGEMRMHDLPWPVAALQQLGELEVEMRVTLSYFIEPNPSSRVGTRYRYQSHGLRFDCRRPTESAAAFRARVNRSARDDAVEAGTTTEDTGWLLGQQARHRGSLHSDIWVGTAADLASRGMIAVFPTSGWWKTRPKQMRYDRVARYALLVSLRSPEVGVDLYTPILTRIAATIVT